MAGNGNTRKRFSAWCAAGMMLVMAGCTTTRPVPDPPPPEVVIRDCLAEYPEWLFEPLDTPGLERVSMLGGLGKHIVMVVQLQVFLLESANQRLTRIFEIHNDARDRCRSGTTR